MPHAHAHNDYEHTRPLLDALEHGFCSVEADVWLVDGKLLVAHDRAKVQSGRTLQTLYLDPLRERAQKNGGKIFRDGPEFFLLIDIKSDAEKTYGALRDIFKQYPEILTAFRDGKTEAKAITIVITGNRPRKLMASESLRFAGVDGRLEDLDSPHADPLLLWISDHWQKNFKWRGVGSLPADEKIKLKDIVAQAHDRNQKVRFWSAPDAPDAWRELREAGVDLINTDDLAGLEKFLKAAERSANPSGAN